MIDDIGRIDGLILNPNSAKTLQDRIAGKEKDKKAQQDAVPQEGASPVETESGEIDDGTPHLLDIVI